MSARVAVLLALALACGRAEVPAPTTGTTPASAAPVAAPPVAFDDPEPPDAQARAEAVVNEPYNRNKTTKLVMKMTPIVARTSEVQGLAIGLVPREDKIEDRLARLGAKVTETEVVIQLPGAILFDFDSAEIRPDAERALTDVAEVIRSYANRPVRVEGHTDSMADDEYNQKLSERRAASVAAWLGSHGIETSRVRTAGFGEKRPVASNDTSDGRQRNRRVEVVIAKK